MPFIITPESPDTADAVALIGELEAQLEPYYPRASRHGLSVAQLIQQQVAFFLLRSEDQRPATAGRRAVPQTSAAPSPRAVPSGGRSEEDQRSAVPPSRSEEGVPAACGGVKLFGAEYGEVKRMYVRPQFRGRGFAKAVLDHLAAYTQAHGVPLLRLETGIHQREAIGLYERAGFHRIPPFGDYTEDPLSVFFEKRIT